MGAASGHPNVLDTLPVRVFWKNRDLIYTGCNRAFALDAGLGAPDEIAGKSDFDLPWTAEAEAWRRADRAVLEGGTSADTTAHSVTLTGNRPALVRITRKPLLDHDGAVVGVVGTYDDMGERAALISSAERYRNLVEHIPVAVFRTTSDGRIVLANQALCRMLGFEDMAELLEADIRNDFYVNPGQRDELTRVLTEKGELRNVELHLRRKDGRTIIVLENCRAVYDEPGGPPYYEGTLVDITERKRADESLRREQQFTDRVIDAIPGIFFVIDERRRYVRWNHAHEVLFGLPPERIRELDALSRIHEDDRALVASKIEEIFAHGAAEVEARGLVGTGPQIRHFLMTGRRIELGGSLYIIGCGVDITERKEAEAARARLEAELLHAQKLESIGRLAGGVAHDFNNLLTVINGYGSLVLAKLEDPALRDSVKQIVDAGERAAALTKQLLAFSRRQIVQPKPLDLNAVIEETGKMIRRVIGEDIQLLTSLAPGLPPVLADRGQISQLLLNLSSNARDAMPEHGTLVIETRSVVLDANYTASHPAVTPGTYVLLAVTDSGEGMDASALEHIFEPFFTTKEPGSGTGLGLATVHGIVKQAGGHVWIYSERGYGTTVKVYLPAVEGAAETEAASEHLEPDLVGSGTILVAEDQTDVRALVSHVLRAYGYRVLTASNGEEALAVAARETRAIDLLITDVVMPGLNGRELAERLGRLRPRMKVLFISGYTEDTVVRRGVLKPDLNYLSKPFGPAALLTSIRRILDGEV
jgi:two-component system cell cycle sensor histidine kinase/response regulator CckA